MPEVILLAVQYGGYISIIKLVIFLGLFFLWLLLLNWVHKDAKALGIQRMKWSGILMGAAALGTVIWFVIPIFIISLFVYIAIVGGAAIVYIRTRNSLVMEFDRILTLHHFTSMLAKKSKKIEAMSDFVFYTSNNNEVPIPEPKTPDFFGFRTAHDILKDALWRRANIISFTPSAEGYSVVYFVDGAGMKQPELTKEQMDYFIHFLKHLANLDIEEKRKPQKGKFRTMQKKENTDWELTTAGSTAGEQVRIKPIVKGGALRLNDLGFTTQQYQQLQQFKKIKQGLFLITGPAKSGITSTMYALLRDHDAFMNSIVTIEMHTSGDLLNITQNVFTLTDTGTTTYAGKLATIARMGPDIIGVGDCPDGETAQVASKIALDGKLIYQVMSADSVIQALGKWMKLVGDKKLVSKSLLGICNQRILRKLCETCKQGYAPNKELLKKFNLPAEKAKVMYRPGKEIYDKRGKGSVCPDCQGTGFKGRMGVYEMIVLTDELRESIRQLKSLPEIGMQFRRAKMLYLQEEALKKVITGSTAINEMLRVLSSSRKKRV
jgi:type II secretory ATPase GspE/PulE/Tfp pilus assembly ATPase PilB-like protein